MAWVKIDDEFYDHPRWCDAPGDSIALWLASMAWCNRNESVTGLIPKPKTAGLVHVRNLKASLADLCDRGAFYDTPAGYLIHDYAEYQQPEKVREIAAKRSANGKKGAAARWGKYTERKATSKAKSIANAIANATPEKCPVSRLPSPDTSRSTHSSSSLSVVPDAPADATDDDDAFEGVIAAVVEAKVSEYRPVKPRAYRAAVRRNTIAEDGDLIRSELAVDGDIDRVALFVLGYGTTAAKERTETAWCASDCEHGCEGDGWTRTADGLAPCPGRTQ